MKLNFKIFVSKSLTKITKKSKTIYLMNDHFEVVNDKDKNNVEFWKNSIENFDKLVGQVHYKPVL